MDFTIRSYRRKKIMTPEDTGKATRPQAEINEAVIDSLGRLRRLCRVPIDESEQNRSIRLGKQANEFMELFSSNIAKSREGLFHIFKLVDADDEDQPFYSKKGTCKPVLAAAREYLRLELSRMQRVMDQHLKRSDSFEPTLRGEMQLIAQSEFMLSRPSAQKVMTSEEVKESLKGSCVIPRKDLNGHGWRRVDEMFGYLFYHVAEVTCAEPV